MSTAIFQVLQSQRHSHTQHSCTAMLTVSVDVSYTTLQGTTTAACSCLVCAVLCDCRLDFVFLRVDVVGDGVHAAVVELVSSCVSVCISAYPPLLSASRARLVTWTPPLLLHAQLLHLARRCRPRRMCLTHLQPRTHIAEIVTST